MKPIHEELKELRLEKGITLEKIYDATKIRVAILEKIEEGNFTVVPQPFVRAFLREYARVIGVDPERVIQRYENKVNFISKSIIPSTVTEENDQEVTAAKDKPKRKKSSKDDTDYNKGHREISSVSDDKSGSAERTIIDEKEGLNLTAATEENGAVPKDDTEQSHVEDGSGEEKPAQTDDKLTTDSSESPARIEIPATPGEQSKPDAMTPHRRLDIEEPGASRTVSIILFVIIIIIAAIIIVWINRGL